MRIGLVGTDSSHAEQFLRFLNAEQRYPGHVVEALSLGDSVRLAELCNYYDVLNIFAEPGDMIGRVDAVIVGARDGGAHLAHARPFLEAGLPVFVDKPLALSTSDATAMIDLARRGKALLTSASALRWQPLVAELRARCERATSPVQIDVTGTFYPDSEYGRCFFYGVHSVEMALELAGHSFAGVAVERATREIARVNFHTARASVKLNLVTPPPGAESWFGVTVTGADGSTGGQVTLGDDYMAPVLDRFMVMIATDAAPLSADELLAPVALLELVEAGLSRL